MKMEVVEQMINEVIPKLEENLKRLDKVSQEFQDEVDFYESILKVVAPYDFNSFNKYMEFDKDKVGINTGFHHTRGESMKEVCKVLNDMEVYDKHDIVMISLPPRTGKTSYLRRFASWVEGRNPQKGVRKVYASGAEVLVNHKNQKTLMTNSRYKDIFPDTSGIPELGYMVGGGNKDPNKELDDYLLADDIVDTIKSVTDTRRSDRLWDSFLTNHYQMKKGSGKMVMVGSRLAEGDPMGRIDKVFSGNNKFALVTIPALDEDGQSNFDHNGGFTTEQFEDIKSVSTEGMFDLAYQQIAGRE